MQAGGVLTKLPNKVGVKSGDYVMLGGTAAVRQNNRAVKLYLNAVVFSSPGEEIVFANSVSGAELMRMAEQQGLRPAGFSASPGGFERNLGPRTLQGVTHSRSAGLRPTTGVVPFRARRAPMARRLPGRRPSPFGAPPANPFAPR